MTTLLICWKAFWLTLAIVVGIALLIKVIVDAINGKKYAKIIGAVLLAVYVICCILGLYLAISIMSC